MDIYYDPKYQDFVIATNDKFVFLNQKTNHKILYSKESKQRLIKKEADE